MRIRTLAGTFLLGAACALIGANAISQQHDHDHDHSGHDHGHGHDHGQQMTGDDDAMMQQMMQKWMEVATPNENHAMLEYFIGDWNAVSSMRVDPNQPPMEESAKATFEWTLDKHFVEQTYSGTMMGMPYNGRGLSGYDNYKKKWVSTWANSMGTNIIYMEGTIDQTGKVWTYFGTMDEWMTGEHDKMVKYVTRILSDDKFVFEVHDLAIVPGETKVVEVTYTRAE